MMCKKCNTEFMAKTFFAKPNICVYCYSPPKTNDSDSFFREEYEKIKEYVTEKGLYRKYNIDKSPVDIIIVELEKQITLKESIRRAAMQIINLWRLGSIKVTGNASSILSDLRRKLTF